jgi:hypothetical protein
MINTRSAFALVTLSSALAASATTFTGDPGADGLAFVGNSLSTSPVIWARGNTAVNYDAYASGFQLGAGDSFSNSAAVGSAQGTLANGSSWQVGDTIVAMGMRTSGFTVGSMTFKFDAAGTSGWKPATSVGGSDGVASFTAAASAGSLQIQMLQAIANGQFAPQASRYRDGLNVDFQASNPAFVSYASAVKGWAVVSGSDPNAYLVQSAILLVNTSELMRIAHPAAMALGPTSKFSFQVDTTEVSFAQAVPEPATMSVLGLMALLKARRLRKKAQA